MRTQPMRLLAFFLAAFAVALAGCATSRTFDDKVAVSSVSITRGTNAITALAAARRISKAEAQNSLDASRAASAALDLGQRMNEQAPGSGNAQIVMAESILTGIELFLNRYGMTMKEPK